MRRAPLTLALAFLFSRIACAAVSFDNATTATQSNSASDLVWAHATTGSLLFLHVACALGGGGGDDSTNITGVTYNGVSLTTDTGTLKKHSANDTWGYLQVFYLAGPASGSHNVDVAVSATATSLVCGAVTLTGVDQTTPINSGHIASAAGAGTSASVGVSSAAGNMVVDATCIETPGTFTTNQTEDWNVPFSGSTRCGNSASARAAGAASVTMTWTIPSNGWSIIGVDVNADMGGAPPACNGFALLGAGKC